MSLNAMVLLCYLLILPSVAAVMFVVRTPSAPLVLNTRGVLLSLQMIHVQDSVALSQTLSAGYTDPLESLTVTQSVSQGLAQRARAASSVLLSPAPAHPVLEFKYVLQVVQHFLPTSLEVFC